MLKGYEAIYKDGRVEWIGPAPQLSNGRVLVVVDEVGDTANPPSNGDALADCIEHWDSGARRALLAEIGDPVAWQREQRQGRALPGRESA